MTEILKELFKAQKNALLFWLLPIAFLMILGASIINLASNTTILIITTIAVFWLLIGFIRAVYFFFKFTFYFDRSR